MLRVPGGVNPDKMGIDGIFLPLSDLISENAYYLSTLFNMYPVVRKGITAHDGEIYSYPGFGEGIITGPKDMELGEREDPGANITLFVPGIRQDWLDALDLKHPTTLDEWYNVLKAFKEQDPNGNGLQDEIPITSMTDYKDIFNLGSGVDLIKNDQGDTYWLIDKDNQLTFRYTDERMIELLAFYNKLYSEGLLDPEFALPDYSKTVEKIHMNLVGSLASAWNSNYASYTNNLREGGIEEALWTSVYPPVDSSGQSKVYNRWSIWKLMAISKDCENPDLAMKWLDFHCLSPEGLELLNFGIEGMSYEKNGDDYVFTDFILNNPDGLGPYEALRSIGGWSQLPHLQTKEMGVAINRENPHQLEFAAGFSAEQILDPIPALSYLAEEQEIRDVVLTDLVTIMDEYLIGFIDGSIPLDNFSTYVKELESLGLSSLQEIEQAAYTRYLAG